MLTNSSATRDRIRSCYGTDAAVVYPPADLYLRTEGEQPADLPADVHPGSYLISAGRLVPGKKLDMLASAARIARRKLVIVGTGRAE